MSFTLQAHYHADVLTIRGRFLGSIERNWIQQIFEDQVGTGHLHLVVDLSRVTFMDSAAIGLLIHGAQRVRDAGGEVRLAGVQRRIHGLLAMTRLLGPVFEHYPTVEEAIQSFAGARAPRTMHTMG